MHPASARLFALGCRLAGVAYSNLHGRSYSHPRHQCECLTAAARQDVGASRNAQSGRGPSREGRSPLPHHHARHHRQDVQRQRLVLHDRHLPVRVVVAASHRNRLSAAAVRRPSDRWRRGGQGLPPPPCSRPPCRPCRSARSSRRLASMTRCAQARERASRWAMRRLSCAWSKRSVAPSAGASPDPSPRPPHPGTQGNQERTRNSNCEKSAT